MPKDSTGKRRASKRLSSKEKIELVSNQVVYVVCRLLPYRQEDENGLPSEPLSEYELKRLKRIEENKAVLKSLNIIQVA